MPLSDIDKHEIEVIYFEKKWNAGRIAPGILLLEVNWGYSREQPRLFPRATEAIPQSNIRNFLAGSHTDKMHTMWELSNSLYAFLVFIVVSHRMEAMAAVPAEADKLISKGHAHVPSLSVYKH